MSTTKQKKHQNNPFQFVVFLFLSWLLTGDVALADAPRLRVMSYNIRHGEGIDGKVDLPRIAEVIIRAKPDVVVLQEVDKNTQRTNRVDQAAELGRLTGMHAAFAKMKDYQGGDYGNAVLSRAPILRTQTYQTLLGDDPALKSVIAVETAPCAGKPSILVVGAHLDFQNASLRLQQAKELNAMLTKHSQTPMLLVGDMNSTPGSAPIVEVAQHWSDALDDPMQKTFPADRPKVLIDYVFFRPASAWRVVEKRVIEEPMASDHRPVLIVFEM